MPGLYSLPVICCHPCLRLLEYVAKAGAEYSGIANPQNNTQLRHCERVERLQHSLEFTVMPGQQQTDCYAESSA